MAFLVVRCSVRNADKKDRRRLSAAEADTQSDVEVEIQRLFAVYGFDVRAIVKVVA